MPNGENPEGSLKAIRRTNHPLSCLAAGFKVLHEVLPSQESTELHEVVIKLSSYTLAVDDFVMGRPQARSLKTLANQRNFVQHCLMSKHPSKTEKDLGENDSFYTACWFAAVIYSLITVFPIPHWAAPFVQLSLQIKDTISSPTIKARWAEAPSLMLWVTVMGAIAAVNLPERSWYISVLERLTNRLKITSWDDMRTELQNFLWFNSVSEPDGQRLWKEVKKSSPFSG